MLSCGATLQPGTGKAVELEGWFIRQDRIFTFILQAP